MFKEIIQKNLKVSGLSRYKIEQKTGVKSCQVGNFVSGKKDLTGKSLEKLFEFFGIECCEKSNKKEIKVNLFVVVSKDYVLNVATKNNDLTDEEKRFLTEKYGDIIEIHRVVDIKESVFLHL